jgi:hypothetical protein
LSSIGANAKYKREADLKGRAGTLGRKLQRCITPREERLTQMFNDVCGEFGSSKGIRLCSRF